MRWGRSGSVTADLAIPHPPPKRGGIYLAGANSGMITTLVFAVEGGTANVDVKLTSALDPQVVATLLLEDATGNIVCWIHDPDGLGEGDEGCELVPDGEADPLETTVTLNEGVYTLGVYLNVEHYQFAEAGEGTSSGHVGFVLDFSPGPPPASDPD